MKLVDAKYWPGETRNPLNDPPESGTVLDWSAGSGFRNRGLKTAEIIALAGYRLAVGREDLSLHEISELQLGFC